jgi:hypothetical protein
MKARPLQRLITASVRAQLLYGIERWGGLKRLTDLADKITWTAARRTFGITIETPVRAISSFYGLEPTRMIYDYRSARLESREERNGVWKGLILEGAGVVKTLDWRNEVFGEGMEVREMLGEEDQSRLVRTLESWSRETDLLIYTDGSKWRV